MQFSKLLRVASILSFTSVAIFFSFAVATASATPVVINDNFIGGSPTNAAYNGLDIIGDANKFNIDRMEVNISAGLLTIDIFSTYFDNPGEFGTELGDLFISTNGWHPFGAAPYLQDNASNGESWEFALVMSNHSAGLGASGAAALYSVADGAIVLSDQRNDPNAVIFRGNQEVLFVSRLNAPAAPGTWSIVDLAGDLDKLTFSITLSSLGLISPEGLGLHWAMTCANDVIEGAAPVPEPASAILLLSGAGLALLRRKRG